jgi:hypothetical protein
LRCVGRNLLNALDDLDCIQANPIQLLRDSLALFHFLFNCFGRGVDAIGDTFHVALNLPNQLLNLLCALLRGLGQGTHFIGHHGKTLAVLAGAGRFNGCIEGQQIGLVGDAGHGLHNVADVGGLLFQFDHHAHGVHLALGGDAHIADQSGHIGAGAPNQRLAGLALGAAGVGILQLAGDGHAHLLKGRQGLLCRARSFFGSGGDLVAGALQFFGCAGGFGNARGQLPGGGGDAFGRLLLLGEGPRPFALRLRLAGGCGGRFPLRGSDFLNGRFLDESHGSILSIWRSVAESGGFP